MSSADQIHVMLLKKFGNDFSTKGKGDASIAFAPTHRFLVRIRPQEIAEDTLVRYICRAGDLPDLFHGLKIWTQSTVAAENLLIDNCRNGQAIETVRKCFPKLDVTASKIFKK